MKVVCITTVHKVFNPTTLTIGKVYEVKNMNNNSSAPTLFKDYYNGVDDSGNKSWMLKDLFIPLREYRKKKLEKLNNEYNMYK